MLFLKHRNACCSNTKITCRFSIEWDFNTVNLEGFGVLPCFLASVVVLLAHHW